MDAAPKARFGCVVPAGESYHVKRARLTHIRSTFVPGEAHCMCLFEAADPQVVKDVPEAFFNVLTKLRLKREGRS